MKGSANQISVYLMIISDHSRIVRYNNLLHQTIMEIFQTVLQEETKINRLHQELFSQFTSHSEKDKLASISYDYDARSVSYEAYLSAKATIAENTMPSAPNFEPACITNAGQKMVSPISVTNSNDQKSETLNGPIPPLLPRKPVELMGGLERYPMQRSASAPEIRNL